IDRHALHVVAARHRDLDQSGTGLPFDFGLGELVLRPLHVLLHLLRLLHQAGKLVLHHRKIPLAGLPATCVYDVGLIESDRIFAPKRVTISLTNGSPRNAASIFAFCSAASRCLSPASEASAGTPTSNANIHRPPVAWSSAIFSLSAYILSARCLCVA